MSVAKIKQQLDLLSAADQQKVAAYLFMLQKRADPEWLAEIARRNRVMDAGKKVTQAELERILEGGSESVGRGS